MSQKSIMPQRPNLLQGYLNSMATFEERPSQQGKVNPCPCSQSSPISNGKTDSFSLAFEQELLTYCDRSIKAQCNNPRLFPLLLASVQAEMHYRIAKLTLRKA
eukprot:3833410-Amphidinium_carterae.2